MPTAQIESVPDEAGRPVGLPVAFEEPPALRAITERGRFVALAPLQSEHAAGLWEAVRADPGIWTYLPIGPCSSVDDVAAVVEDFRAAFIPHVITDPEGTVLGTASYLRVQPTIGSAEVGAIVFGTRLQRSAAATEAMTLLARHAMNLGYRRYEWKCDALNAASCAAAMRLGFRPEGVWRNATMYKGRNRDTAWFAMTDTDWRLVEPVHRAWLAEAGPDTQPFRLSQAVATALAPPAG